MVSLLRRQGLGSCQLPFNPPALPAAGLCKSSPSPRVPPLPPWLLSLAGLDLPALTVLPGEPG